MQVLPSSTLLCGAAVPRKNKVFEQKVWRQFCSHKPVQQSFLHYLEEHRDLRQALRAPISLLEKFFFAGLDEDNKR